MAKVTVALLVTDFLFAYELLVDVKKRHLIDTVTFCLYACTLSAADFIRLSSLLSAADKFLHPDCGDHPWPIRVPALAFRPEKHSNASWTLLGVTCLSYSSIWITSLSPELPGQSRCHFWTLFEQLSHHGLIVNSAKCQLGLTTINFLRHRVTKDAAVPHPSKVDAIINFPHPLTVKSLQECLGIMNFYHSFIPQASQPVRPLYKALKGRVTKHTVARSAEKDKACPSLLLSGHCSGVFVLCLLEIICQSV